MALLRGEKTSSELNETEHRGDNNECNQDDGCLKTGKGIFIPLHS